MTAATSQTEAAARVEAIRYYADPDHCQTVMVEARWPNGVQCPTCGAPVNRYISTRRRSACDTKHPRRHFPVKVGTILEDSPLGLDKWLPAVCMIANCENGGPSRELGRAPGATQKTAWFMLHRMRLAMRTGTLQKKRGRVEVDGTFIGGDAPFMHKDRRKTRSGGKHGGFIGKTVAMALLQRHGPDKASTARAFIVPSTKKRYRVPVVRASVAPGSAITANALKSYDSLEDAYTRNVIDHPEAHVRGHIHATGMDTCCSLLKRAIEGTYVGAQPWHVLRYVDEEVLSYNRRRDADVDSGRFGHVLRSVTGRRVDGKTLTGKTLRLSPA